jgi:hypothetical protein
MKVNMYTSGYDKGTFFWKKNGLLHRDNDKPALITPDGVVYWYKDGKQHRDGDKPAIIYPNGFVLYYKDGVVVKDPLKKVKDVFLISIKKLYKEFLK